VQRSNTRSGGYRARAAAAYRSAIRGSSPGDGSTRSFRVLALTGIRRRAFSRCGTYAVTLTVFFIWWPLTRKAASGDGTRRELVRMLVRFGLMFLGQALTGGIRSRSCPRSSSRSATW